MEKRRLTEKTERYAESIQAHLLSADGRNDLSIRLARFPHRGQAHVWFHFASPRGAYSLVDDTFNTDAGVTAFGAGCIALQASNRSGQTLTLNREKLDGQVTISIIRANLLVSKTRHPQTGSGTIPVEFRLEFLSGKKAWQSTSGRLELTGKGRGEVCVQEGEDDNMCVQKQNIEGAAKWHEQRGSRSHFAPPFIYLNAHNEDASLLVIRFRNRVQGYVTADGSTHGIQRAIIEGPGSEERKFEITLDNHRVVRGIARVVQRWSVPIEGTRRPGSSVLIDSDIGLLAGSLNDWVPAHHPR